MTPVSDTESLMEQSGLGLLPGIVLALGVVVFAMGLLLLDSMWAVLAVLGLIGLVTGVILTVVIALLDDDGDLGTRLRRYIPGLGDGPGAV